MNGSNLIGDLVQASIAGSFLQIHVRGVQGNGAGQRGDTGGRCSDNQGEVQLGRTGRGATGLARLKVRIYRFFPGIGISGGGGRSSDGGGS